MASLAAAQAMAGCLRHHASHSALTGQARQLMQSALHLLKVCCNREGVRLEGDMTAADHVCGQLIAGATAQPVRGSACRAGLPRHQRDLCGGPGQERRDHVAGAGGQARPVAGPAQGARARALGAAAGGAVRALLHTVHTCAYMSSRVTMRFWTGPMLCKYGNQLRVTDSMHAGSFFGAASRFLIAPHSNLEQVSAQQQTHYRGPCCTTGGDCTTSACTWLLAQRMCAAVVVCVYYTLALVVLTLALTLTTSSATGRPPQAAREPIPDGGARAGRVQARRRAGSRLAMP